MTSHATHSRLTALLCLACLTLALPSRADQSTAVGPAADDRWNAWIGCWMPTGRSQDGRDIQLCVIPTADGRGVRAITLADAEPIFEETIVADAAPSPHVENGCTGERRSQWSADGDRLYTQAELRCDGSPVRRSVGISAMVGAVQWLDLQLATIDGIPQVRVRRYARLFSPWPAALADQAPPAASQLKTPGPLTADDLAEAHSQVGSDATEAWLFESDAHVPIDARVLRHLSARGVSEKVLDLLVARAYPKRFEVQEPNRSALGGWSLDDLMWSAASDFDPYAMYYAPFDPFFGRGIGFWQYAGYVPVMFVNVQTQGQGRARVVNGYGYTQIEERPRPSSGGGGSAEHGGGGSTSASVSAGGYSGGGGGATGLTAVAR